MQVIPDIFNVFWVIPLTLLTLVFSLIRISATWRYRVIRKKEKSMSWFSRFGNKLANGGNKAFNVLNMIIVISGQGIILAYCVYLFLSGWGVGYLFPILFSIVGVIIAIGFIRFSQRGKRWFTHVLLEMDYYENPSDVSILEKKIENLVDAVNQGTEIQSNHAISKLEYLLRKGYDFGTATRSILEKVDSGLYSEYKSTSIRRITRLKITSLILILGTVAYLFLVVFVPDPIYLFSSNDIEPIFRILLSNYFIQLLFLVFGYEGSLDTKFV